MEHEEDDNAMDSNSEDDQSLTTGEMVQLLIQNLKEYGSDVKGFGVFLERFSREHEAFLGNISEIFVCTVSRQCVHLAEILLDRYLPGTCTRSRLSRRGWVGVLALTFSCLSIYI